MIISSKLGNNSHPARIRGGAGGRRPHGGRRVGRQGGRRGPPHGVAVANRTGATKKCSRPIGLSLPVSPPRCLA